MKVSVLNKTDKQVFLEISKDYDKVFPIGAKSKIIVDIENDTDLINLQKKFRKILLFRKI